VTQSKEQKEYTGKEMNALSRSQAKDMQGEEDALEFVAT
jgi:hypothetical protein